MIESLESSSIPNHSYKLQLYQSLKQLPDLTNNEIIEAIETASILDYDLILMDIISQKSLKQSNVYENQLKILEDKELDRAILVSEQDREFEENRKRLRVLDLKFNCFTPINDAFEFKNSLLLGYKLNMSNLPWKGSQILQKLVHDFDSKHQNKICTINLVDEDEPLCCSCNSITLSIRELIIRLLYLERDALKYEELSFSYLQTICDTIDIALTPTSSRTLDSSHNTDSLHEDSTLSECSKPIKVAVKKGWLLL